MHLDIIDDKRINFLQRLKKIESIKMFALGGGTGLSLLLGLRTSYDFDFFTSEHFNTDVLLNEIKNEFGSDVIVISQEKRLSTLDLMIDDIKISFFEYQYPRLKECIPFDEFAPIKILSISDIACMKSIEIIQRGTKKDFFDLYFIIKYLDITAEELLDLLYHKFNDNNVKYNLMLSIVYFEDAETDVLPMSFVDYSWNDIKTFFGSFQKELKKALK